MNATIVTKRLIITFIASVLLLTGCASSPNKISAAYVSPYKYKDHDCDGLILEIGFVANRVTELHESLKKNASDDVAAGAVGVIFFPLVLLALAGDGDADNQEAAEYAQLKGEFNAIKHTAISKNCDTSAIPENVDLLINPAVQTEFKKYPDVPFYCEELPDDERVKTQQCL